MLIGIFKAIKVFYFHIKTHIRVNIFIINLNFAGNSLIAKNKDQDAIEAYNQAIELDANYVNANRNKGVSLLKLKKYDEAIKYFGLRLEKKKTLKNILN